MTFLGSFSNQNAENIHFWVGEDFFPVDKDFFWKSSDIN